MFYAVRLRSYKHNRRRSHAWVHKRRGRKSITGYYCVCNIWECRFFSRGEDTFRGCVFSDNTGYFNIPAINKKMIAGGSIFDTDSIPAIGYMHPDWGYKRFFNNKEIPASGLNLQFSKPSENRSPITEFCNDYTIEWCNENLN